MAGFFRKVAKRTGLKVHVSTPKINRPNHRTNLNHTDYQEKTNTLHVWTDGSKTDKGVGFGVHFKEKSPYT